MDVIRLFQAMACSGDSTQKCF